MRLLQARSQGGGLLQLGHGFIQRVPLLQRQRQIVMGLGVVGREREELSILRDRRREIAFLNQRHAEVVQGHLIAGFELERRVELADGSRGITFLYQRQPEIVARLYEVRLEPDDFAESLNRPVQILVLL